MYSVVQCHLQREIAQKVPIKAISEHLAELVDVVRWHSNTEDFDMSVVDNVQTLCAVVAADLVRFRRVLHSRHVCATLRRGKLDEANSGSTLAQPHVRRTCPTARQRHVPRTARRVDDVWLIGVQSVDAGQTVRGLRHADQHDGVAVELDGVGDAEQRRTRRRRRDAELADWTSERREDVHRQTVAACHQHVEPTVH